MATSEVISPIALQVTMTTQDTEYSVELPAGCKHFEVSCSTSAIIRMAFVTGKVAGPTAPVFFIPAGRTYRSPEKLSYAGGTLYLAGGSGGLIVTVLAWT